MVLPLCEFLVHTHRTTLQYYDYVPEPPLQNPTLGIHEGGNVLERQTELWSTKAKV
jgi:hypothetical protein